MRRVLGNRSGGSSSSRDTVKKTGRTICPHKRDVLCILSPAGDGDTATTSEEIFLSIFAAATGALDDEDNGGWVGVGESTADPTIRRR